GFFESFVDSAFGGATGVVVVVVVVVEPVVDPEPVVTDAVTVVVFPFPLPAPPPWPLPVVVFEACEPPDFGAWLGPFAGEPCVLPPPALPCETVVVGALGAFGAPALPFP